MVESKVREFTPEQNATLDEWVAALRSGEWPQTQDYLHRLEPHGARPAGFCCLGVLCKIKDVPEQESHFHTEIGVFRFDGGGSTATLPDSWFRTETGFGTSEMSVLMEANDAGLPFDRIADEIDKLRGKQPV